MMFDWTVIVGLIGTLLALLAYLLLQMQRVTSTGLAYSLINGVGSVGIIISLFYHFNLAAMLMEIAWLLISIYGIARGWRQRGAV